MADLNFRGFNILNAGADPVKASAAFKYKDYLISMSTIFFPPSIAILNPKDNAFFMEVETVEHAIAWIDENS